MAMTPEERKRRDEFFESQQWRELRYFVIRRDGARCVACGRTPSADRICIHVDHIKPISLHWELRADPANLQVLCEDCNLGKSNHHQDDWRPKVDAGLVGNGDVVLTHALLMRVSGGKRFVALTSKQVRHLGMRWPIRNGWLQQLIGKRISQADWIKLGELREDKNRARAAKAQKQVPLHPLQEKSKALTLEQQFSEGVVIYPGLLGPYIPPTGMTVEQERILGFSKRPSKKQRKRLNGNYLTGGQWRGFVDAYKTAMTRTPIQPTP